MFKSVVFVALITTALHGQIPANLAFDQPPTQDVIHLANQAFAAECYVLMQNNQAVSTCGGVNMVRNSSLQGWGFTTPRAMFQSDVRYNPVILTNVVSQFPSPADQRALAFFIFAHEVGHHFDLQFHPVVPWNYQQMPPFPIGLPAYYVVSWSNELRADAWAGCAMKQTNSSLLAIGSVTQLTAQVHNNPDIPPAQLAWAAINLGFNAC